MDSASLMCPNNSTLGQGTCHPAEDPKSDRRESNLPCRQYDDDLEVVPCEYTPERNIGLQLPVGQGKEAISGLSQGKEAAFNQDPQPLLQLSRHGVAGSKLREKTWERPWRWILGITIIAVITIVIAATVAVMETRKHREHIISPPRSSANSTNNGSSSWSTQPTPSSNSPNNGSSSSPTVGSSSSPTNDAIETSTQGAYKGTGLAVIDPTNTDDALAWLIYQHYSGSLMGAKYNKTGSWQPPEDLGVLDALNGTSIAAVSYQPANLTVVGCS